MALHMELIPLTSFFHLFVPLSSVFVPSRHKESSKRKDRKTSRQTKTKSCTFFIRHHCLVTSVLLARGILLHGSLSWLNRPLLSWGVDGHGRWTLQGKRDHVFSMNSNAVILAPLGTLASPPLLLSFFLKRVLFMHQPFLVFVITQFSSLHKKQCLKKQHYTSHYIASNTKVHIQYWPSSFFSTSSVGLGFLRRRWWHRLQPLPRFSPRYPRRGESRWGVMPCHCTSDSYWLFRAPAWIGMGCEEIAITTASVIPYQSSFLSLLAGARKWLVTQCVGQQRQQWGELNTRELVSLNWRENDRKIWIRIRAVSVKKVKVKK